MHLICLVHSSPLGQQLLDHIQVSILGGYEQWCISLLRGHKRWSAEVKHRDLRQPGADAPALVLHSVTASLVAGSCIAQCNAAGMMCDMHGSAACLVLPAAEPANTGNKHRGGNTIPRCLSHCIMNLNIHA